MNKLQKLLYVRVGPQWRNYGTFDEQFSLQASTVTGTFRDNFPLVLDISQYQQVIDWPKLKADGLGGFIWIRASYGAEGQGFGGGVDALVADHVQHAFDMGIPCGLYHALDPGYYFYKLQSLGKVQQIDTYLPVDKDEQIQTLIKAAKFKRYYALAIDYELFRDWNGNTMPDGWLNEVVFQFLIRVRKVFPGVPIYFYSGSWFIWNYVKSLETTGRIKGLAKLWTAYYPYGAGVVNLADADDLKPLYPPNDMTITFPDGKRVTQNPPYLGFDGWNFWQFTGDKFTLPYITDTLSRPSALDFNFYNGTLAQLYAEIGYTAPVPEPEPEPEPEPSGDLAEVLERIAQLQADITEIRAFVDGVKGIT